MRTIITLTFILFTYSHNITPPLLIEIGTTSNEVVRLYGKPNKVNKVLIGGLYCEDWTYYQPKMLVRFRNDRVIYIE